MLINGRAGRRAPLSVMAFAICAVAFTLVVVLADSRSTASAQGPSVVAIPDSGDPLANGQALLDAVAAATASGQPTTIELAAGVFNLNGAPMVLPGGIDLVGQGETTELCLCGVELVGEFGRSRDVGSLSIRGDTSLRDFHFNPLRTPPAQGDWGILDHLGEIEVTAGDSEMIRLESDGAYRGLGGNFVNIVGGSLALIDSAVRDGSIGVESGAEFTMTRSSVSNSYQEIASASWRGSIGISADVGSSVTVTESTISSPEPSVRSSGDVVIMESTISAYEDPYYSDLASAVKMSGGSLLVVDSELRGSDDALLGVDADVRVVGGNISAGSWFGEATGITLTGGTLAVAGTTLSAREYGAGIYVEGTNAYAADVTLSGRWTGVSSDNGLLLDRADFADYQASDDDDYVRREVTCSQTTLSGVVGTPSGCLEVSAERLAFGVGGVWGPAIDGSAHRLPGVIEAEDYDMSLADGVATFGDANASNVGSSIYRIDAVDVYRTRSATGAGYVDGAQSIGAIRGGEFTEYSVDVPAAGTFDFGLRLASGSPDPGGVEVFVDDVSVGAVDIAAGDLGGWWSFTDIAVGQADLSAGRHVVRVEWLAPEGSRLIASR